MNYNKVFNADGTQIRIGEIRFSFARVFEPYQQEGSEVAKYSASIIIPNDNKESLKLVNAGIDAAIAKGVEKGFWPANKLPPKFKNPLHDGDIDREGDPAYEDSMFLNASNTYAPKVMYLEDSLMYPADEEKFYSGCYGAVCLNFFPYNKNGNKGIGVSLGNVIKTRDGESLGGAAQSADASFGDLE